MPKAENAAVFEPTIHFLPKRLSLRSLRDAVQACQGCGLYLNATQAVFGMGSRHARLVLIGEQPGDEEDRQGRPFVGPSGRVLDRALDEAGIARKEVYVTNAVKHFNYEPRGKARLHKKPKPGEVRACRPWLDAEISLIQPAGVVALGATAAQAIFSPSFRVTRSRGQRLATELAGFGVATWHPSNVLRARDSKERQQRFSELVSDLEMAQELATLR